MTPLTKAALRWLEMWSGYADGYHSIEQHSSRPALIKQGIVKEAEKLLELLAQMQQEHGHEDGADVERAVHAAAGSQNEGGLAVTQPPPTRSPGVSRPQLAQFLQRLLAERGFIYRCGSLVLDVEI